MTSFSPGVDLVELVNQAPDPIQSVARDGAIRFVNRSWCEMLGYRAERVRALNFLDLVAGDQRKLWRAWLRDTPCSGEPLRCVTTLIRCDGEAVVVEGNSQVQSLRDGTDAVHTIFRRQEGLLSGTRVLVAEDNAVNRRVLLYLLQQQGCQAEVACDGLEAVECVERQEFDLVIMDLHMPRLDGLEATRRIRHAERATGRHLPIIAWTACAVEGDRQRCLRAGMDEYLTKPLDPRKLAAVLDTFHPSRRRVGGKRADWGRADWGRADSERADWGRGAISANAAGRTASGPAPEQPRDEAADSARGSRPDVFDRDAALRHLGGDQAILEELATLFLEKCPAMLRAVEAAVECRDAAALRQAAHRLKSCVANFFAPQTYEAAESLERQAAAGEVPEPAVELERLRCALRCLEDALRRLTGGSGPPEEPSSHEGPVRE